jgi:hypothetical protein
VKGFPGGRDPACRQGCPSPHIRRKWARCPNALVQTPPSSSSPASHGAASWAPALACSWQRAAAASPHGRRSGWRPRTASSSSRPATTRSWSPPAAWSRFVLQARGSRCSSCGSSTTTCASCHCSAHTWGASSAGTTTSRSCVVRATDRASTTTVSLSAAPRRRISRCSRAGAEGPASSFASRSERMRSQGAKRPIQASRPSTPLFIPPTA